MTKKRNPEGETLDRSVARDHQGRCGGNNSILKARPHKNIAPSLEPTRHRKVSGGLFYMDQYFNANGTNGARRPVLDRVCHQDRSKGEEVASERRC